MVTLTHSFVPNSADNLHCLQASFAMAWQRVTGSELAPDEAERMTGFIPGRDTWPHAAMLAAAQAGLAVRYVENFDPEAFVEDADAELMRSLQDRAFVDEIVATSDIAREQELLRRCLRQPNIEFVINEPSVLDLKALVETPDSAVICNVNSRALDGIAGFRAHFVLVREVNPANAVVIDNPGLPPHPDQHVTPETFSAAWAAKPGHPNLLQIRR